MQKVVKEIIEQDKRKLNVIVSDLPEITKTSSPRVVLKSVKELFQKPESSEENHLEENLQTDIEEKIVDAYQETGRKENRPVDADRHCFDGQKPGETRKRPAAKRKNSTARNPKTGRKSNQPADGTRKKLKCTFCNAQSITNKRDDLRYHIEEEDPDIVGIVETWLHQDIANAELQIPGYQTTRLDRQYKGHGGILLYTKDGIEVQVREDAALAEYEDALWCDISCPSTEADMLLGIMYRSQYNTNEQNDSLNQVLKSLKDEKKDIMVIGDFNYREINWEIMQAGSGRAEAFMDVILDNLWTQHVTKPTRLNSLIDLVITSNPDMVDDVQVVAHLGTSDHCMLIWDTNYLVEPVKSPPKRDFRNANFDQMKAKLRQIKWNEDLETRSAEQAWNYNKEQLSKEIKRHQCGCPRKHRNLLRKQRAWKRYQKRKTSRNLEHYKKCQKEAKYEVRHAKRDFEKKLAENIKEDSKSFYAYVRSKQKVKDAVGPLKTDTGETIPPGQPTAEALNDFFASVFTVENQNVPEPETIYTGPEEEKLEEFVITNDCVKEKLKGLDSSKAAGPDQIPPSVLKECAEELCTPLAYIFNKSLAEGIVPADWRIAHIIPLFKKGSRSKTGNYRPISLTSKGKSCTTNLIEYLEVITKTVDEGIPVDVVYLDLAKAFDTVPHRRLVEKIKAHGIEGKLLYWIEAWLTDRKQKVVTQGAESEWKEVTSSVVQGSVLGPLCFLIYMNDMESNISTSATVSKFADDTKLANPVATDDDIENMQDNINHLQAWAERWQMRYNMRQMCRYALWASEPAHISHGRNRTERNKRRKGFGSAD
ncbi:uncharacterized protein [Amphiura filiformis]|uniref:uncharacterized protein n=1 Tax=Amphiura filiformis TaxID=82378 RepID=UPI003B20E1D0